MFSRKLEKALYRKGIFFYTKEGDSEEKRNDIDHLPKKLS